MPDLSGHGQVEINGFAMPDLQRQRGSAAEEESRKIRQDCFGQGQLAVLRISSCMMGEIEGEVIDGGRAVIASPFADLAFEDSADFRNADLSQQAFDVIKVALGQDAFDHAFQGQMAFVRDIPPEVLARGYEHGVLLFGEHRFSPHPPICFVAYSFIFRASANSALMVRARSAAAMAFFQRFMSR